MSALKFEVDNINELKYTSESFSNVLERMYSGVTAQTTKVSSYLSGLLPTVKSVVEDTSKELELEPIVQLSKDQTKFLEVANKYSFQEMREIKAFTPEGSTCTYLEFLNEINVNLPRITSLRKNVIEQYMLLLAKLVSRDSSIKSITTNKVFLTNLNKDREAAYVSFSKLYVNNSTESVTNVGKVVSRNADWEEVLKQLQSTTDTFNAINIKDIQKDISICNTYLDEIIKGLADDDAINISPETIKQLADYTYEVAKEVEFFSIVHFRLLTLKGCVENTMEQIIKVKG